MSDADKLWAVDPSLASAYLQIKGAFAAQFPGSHLAVAQGFRTPAQQVSASSNGASPFDGSTSWSLHQCFPAKAIDLAVISPAGAYVEDGNDPRYAWTGGQFEQAGFIWGGRFHHPRPDPDHVQTTGHAPRSPAEAGRALAAYQAALAARGQTA